MKQIDFFINLRLIKNLIFNKLFFRRNGEDFPLKILKVN